MLGIDQQIVGQLGRLSVSHTWASELFQLDEEKAYIAEENLDEWIRDEVQKDYPELPRFNPVERGLRNTLLLTLENQALEKLYRHPLYQNLNLPLIESAEEALWVAKMEDIGMEGEMEQKFLAIIRTMLPDEDGNPSRRARSSPTTERITCLTG